MRIPVAVAWSWCFLYCCSDGMSFISPPAKKTGDFPFMTVTITRISPAGGISVCRRAAG